jgi:hypothetical protein
MFIPAGGYDNEEASVQDAAFHQELFVFYFKTLNILLKIPRA